MTNQKTILVTGATGAQGGSVARHLLRRGHFAVRCLTRKPDSDAAQALREAGAEVVGGDLNDIESLRSALRGCHGVFGVTNFWEHFEQEYSQGKNLIDAVAEVGVQHFVFSSLPSVKRHDPNLEVPHFEMKAQLEEYAREKGIPSTFVHVAFYFDNFLNFFPPQKQSDGGFAFGFPQGDTSLAGVAAEDIGGPVARIFEQPAEYMGRTVGIVGDDLPPADYAQAMTRALETPVAYNHINRETFAGFGFPGAEDLANMFDYYRRFIPNRREDLEQSRSLYPSMQSFDEWLDKNAARFESLTNDAVKAAP